MEKVLITGATGFLGQPCLSTLLSCANEVHVLSRNHGGSKQKKLQIHTVDLFDAQQVSAALSQIKPSHLLHLAWLTTPGLYWTATENVRWLEASLKLAQLFAENGGSRMVVAGSCAEYDWRYGRCHETTTPVSFASLYGACKNSLRMILESFGAQIGISIAWARLFFLYGPHEHSNRLVPSVIHSLIQHEDVICTNGSYQRDFLHVQDAAEAVARLLQSNVCGSVNIASGRAVAIREIVQILATHIGEPGLVKYRASPAVASEPLLVVADVTRLREELHWAPQFTLDKGLAQAITWWRSRIQ
jgi:UDP-glucuronate decarboxylase